MDPREEYLTTEDWDKEAMPLKHKVKAALMLSSQLKTGIPTVLIRDSEDPFKSLTTLIQTNDAVNEFLSERYETVDVIFCEAPDDVFVVRSISEVISPTKTSPFASLGHHISDGLLLAEQKNPSCSCRYSPILVHTTPNFNGLFVSGQIDGLPFERFTVPYIHVPGKYNDYFFANVRNFLKSLERR